MLVLKTKYQRLSQVVFSPDGRGLAVAGQHGVYWWKSIFEDLKAIRFGEIECVGIGFIPNGAHLVACLNDKVISAISLQDQSMQHAKLGEGYRPTIAVCATTGFAVAEAFLGNEVSGWRVDSNGTLTRLWSVVAGRGRYGARMAFSPDGSWFVRPSIERDEVGYWLLLRSSATGEVVGSCEGNEWVTAGPAVSPDCRWIAFGFGSSLFFQSVGEPNQRVRVENDNMRSFTDLAFHPSGRYLAATSNDTTVKLYDTTTWTVAKTFTWNIGRMRSIAFSPDGTLAAAGSDTGKVVVWDVDL